MKKALSLLIATTLLMLPGCTSSDKSKTSAAISGATGWASSAVSTYSGPIGSVVSMPEMTSQTTSISSAQIKAIKAGSTYQQIIDSLGATANFGHLNLRQYLVDNDKLLILRFDHITDVCTLSGDELMASTKSYQYPKSKMPDSPKNQTTIYGILIDDRFISCYGQKEGCYYLTGTPTITDANGKAVKMTDIKLMSGLLVTFDYALESYPPQARCLKIEVVN